MPFEAYLMNRFNHTEENRVFRQLVERLDNQYQNENGRHVLVGNIMVGGNEIDAIFIRSGQISIIDFKNYAGQIRFSQNHPWLNITPNGQQIYVRAGNSFLNPYHQVRAYRWGLIDILKNQNFADQQRNWGHIHTIICFHQPINLINENEIPEKLRRRFHICDMNNILELIADIQEGYLIFTDNEIQRILDILEVRANNRYDINQEPPPPPPPQRNNMIDLIDRIIRYGINNNNGNLCQRIINYYNVLLMLEKYIGTDVEQRVSIPRNRFRRNQEMYYFNINENNELFNIWQKNIGLNFPRDIFVGVSITIGNNPTKHLILYTVILYQDVRDNNNVIFFNPDRFELYEATLERLNLAEDIIENIKLRLNNASSFEEKTNVISDTLGNEVGFCIDIEIGIINEYSYNAQLLSELRTLRDNQGINQGRVFDAILQYSAIENPQLQNVNPHFYLRVTNLNKAQERAVKKGLEQNLTVITGPPGTGKSQVVINLIANAILNGYSVLFASKNNKAVDTVRERLDNGLQETELNQYLIRFGQRDIVERTTLPAIQRILARRENIPQERINAELVNINRTIDELKKEYQRENAYFHIEQYVNELNNSEEIRNQLELLNQRIDEFKRLFPNDDDIYAPETRVEQEREIWIQNNHIEELFNIFITQNLALNINQRDISVINTKLEKYNSNHPSLNKLLKLYFKWFKQDKFLKEFEQLYQNVPERIKDYISHNEKWYVRVGVDTLSTMIENIAFINFLIRRENEIRNTNQQYDNEINRRVAIRKGIQELLDNIIPRNLINSFQQIDDHFADTIQSIRNRIEIINNLLIQKDNGQLENQIKERETKLIQYGKQIMRLQINRNVLGINIPNIIQYRNQLQGNLPIDANISRLFLRDFKAIAITNLSIKRGFALERELFDIVIIDEASQCDVASALPLLYRAKRAIIIGDPMQLTHITEVNQNANEYLKQIIFNQNELQNIQVDYVKKSLYHVAKDVACLSNQETIFLDEHYRCHPEIIRFSSDYVYQPYLGQTIRVRTNDEQFPFLHRGIYWINVQGFMHLKHNINEQEIDASQRIYNLIIQRINIADYTIGLISPFRNQSKRLGRIIGNNQNATYGTVHTFQGDEKDIIILSMVISGDQRNINEGENIIKGRINWINEKPYLLNVAITRARSTLYIVGNYDFLMKKTQPNSILRRLLDYCQNRRMTIEEFAQEIN